jgi:AcrR family transcriptional regulator
MEHAHRREQARSGRTREQIVQAALRVFALKGYAAASMDDVCLAAGCSKGGLYHHYPTKQAVLAAVVDRLVAADALVPERGTAAAGGLTAEALGRVLIEVFAEAMHDGALRERLRRGYEARFQAALTAGALPLADLLRIGTLVQLLTRGERTDVEAAAARLGIGRAA